MGAVISRDITERVRGEETRKRLEAQLRQAQKMEAIGTLAGGIAHDFNNVLTGILCNTQLAEFDLPPDHPARPYIAGVEQASMRARDLVAKILTFSRRTEQQFGIHSLPPVVEEALDLLRASLPATIQIRRSLDPGLPPVRCDPGQLHQVVMNLGTNAAHAMAPRGGQIAVSLETAQPESAVTTNHPALAGRDCVRLMISDTGHGMDALTRERIFEPFFTTKPVGEGTGLGLSVVHGIIEDHGGAITVDSAPGRGTTFTVWLPVATSPASGPVGHRDRPSHPMGRGERILVVDDEPAVAQAGARILDRLGYRTSAFTHGADALDAFRRDPSGYAALVSDLTMPDITGADVVREVFALRPHLPVLITTGYMRSQDVEHIRALGVRNFLQKPFTIESLAESVRKTLDRL
jgi:nitrogen-specific signal transduction histidine kinase